LRPALLACLLTAVGCSKDASTDAPPPVSDRPNVSAAPEAAGRPSATTLAASTAPNAAEGVTGVTECDEFLANYRRCLVDQVPAEARSAMQPGLDQWARSWQQLAAEPATRASLPQICAQARSNSQAALQAFHCNF
ncbi:MAG: hypothetical protein KDI56_16395, partial [Xanthomonadales bacterium]|nr:hypothetical protein [Xanthomonadales bacterium]